MLTPSLELTQLEALAAKYKALVALRASRDAAPTAPPAEVRAQLQELSSAFPGCLRELDRLTLPQLLARQAAVEDAITGVATPPWVTWIWAYHVLLKAALAAKRGQAVTTGPNVWPRISPSFLAAALRPPHGKLVPLVLRELGAQMQQSPDDLARWLFPPRPRQS